MKLFGFEVSRQSREDAVVVIAVALLVNGVGELVKNAFDTTGSMLRFEHIEQRLSVCEQRKHESQ